MQMSIFKHIHCAAFAYIEETVEQLEIRLFALFLRIGWEDQYHSCMCILYWGWVINLAYRLKAYRGKQLAWF